MVHALPQPHSAESTGKNDRLIVRRGAATQHTHSYRSAQSNNETATSLCLLLTFFFPYSHCLEHGDTSGNANVERVFNAVHRNLQCAIAYR